MSYKDYNVGRFRSQLPIIGSIRNAWFVKTEKKSPVTKPEKVLQMATKIECQKLCYLQNMHGYCYTKDYGCELFSRESVLSEDERRDYYEKQTLY